MKINLEQVRTLPELLKAKSRKEIALEWGVNPTAINYWIMKHRSKGTVIENKEVKSLIEKI